MANRKRGLIVLVLALVAVLCFGALTACGGVKYAVTWNVSENATVTVTDHDELPSEVAEGTTLTFQVAANSGYEVDSVRANDRTLRADKEGNYSVDVKADTTIEVETIEQVSSVTVKTNPTTMTYYAGEKVDTDGMVVEVAYGSAAPPPRPTTPSSMRAAARSRWATPPSPSASAASIPTPCS